MNQMKTGEMLQWTKRFNQIISAGQTFKNRRMQQLKKDLLESYEGKMFNIHAAYMAVAISEEMEGAVDGRLYQKV